jgi:hypothetical protein
MNRGITLTFGDCAENHVGMQQLGMMANNGFTYKDMKEIRKLFPDKEVVVCKLHRMMENINQTPNMKAYLFVIKNALNKEQHDKLFNEMVALDWDKKAFMKGRVVNKVARYNLCFDTFNQNPDYETGKGRVVRIKDCPELSRLYNKINNVECCKDMKVEGNYYYDLCKCYINFHGDSERKKVIGVRLGDKAFPIHYRWYKNFEPVSEIFSYELEPGDIYIMSEKAVGTDWKKSSIYTLRHAAGVNIK